MKDQIEHKIRSHYLADSGEWLVEKGKVKEARMLKEAHDELVQLRKQRTQYMNRVSVLEDQAARERRLLRKEIELEIRKELTGKFNDAYQNVIQEIRSAAAQIISADHELMKIPHKF